MKIFGNAGSIFNLAVEILMNFMGESMDPCGTPCFIGCWTDDIELLILMEKVCIINSFYTTREEYLLAIYFVICILASEMYKLSKIESRDVSVLCLCRKPFCLLLSKFYLVYR